MRAAPRKIRKDNQLQYGEDDEGEYIESSAKHTYRMGRFWRGGGSKSFSEYFSPMERWINKQVGRHWDDVYKDLRTVVNRDSAVKAHALAHLSSWVNCHVTKKDGRVYRAQFELGEGDLYVDPETCILTRCNTRWADKSPKKEIALIKKSDTQYLARIKDIWYQITYSRIPTRKDFPRCQRDEFGHPDYLYWDDRLDPYQLKLAKIYAATRGDGAIQYDKKQLSKRELIGYGLKNG